MLMQSLVLDFLRFAYEPQERQSLRCTPYHPGLGGATSKSECARERLVSREINGATKHGPPL